jgi:hypothetical protein
VGTHRLGQLLGGLMANRKILFRDVEVALLAGAGVGAGVTWVLGPASASLLEVDSAAAHRLFIAPILFIGAPIAVFWGTLMAAVEIQARSTGGRKVERVGTYLFQALLGVVLGMPFMSVSIAPLLPVIYLVPGLEESLESYGWMYTALFAFGGAVNSAAMNAWYQHTVDSHGFEVG